MKQTEDLLKKDQLKRLSEDIVAVNKDIDKYTKLISLVAPTSFMSHKAQHTAVDHQPKVEDPE